jgi:hypothetical protein
MRAYIFLISLLFQSLFSFAQDLRGGEITITHLTQYTYRANISIYTQASVDIPRQRILHWGDGSTTLLGAATPVLIGTDIYLYSFMEYHSYTGNGLYNIYITDSFRIPGILNIPNSQGSYLIPRYELHLHPAIGFNNSPIFSGSQLYIQNINGVITHNPFAIDPDGDSLHYYLGTPTGVLGYSIPQASSFIQINPTTGEFIWDSPMSVGSYSIAIYIEEYRNGNICGLTVRDMTIDVNSLASIHEVIGGEASIYPNPFTDNLTIEFSDYSFPKKYLVIYNVLGKEVLKENISSLKYSIDTSALPKGIYCIFITDANTNDLTRKILKM